MLKFQGKVTDTSGNPVAGARLTVTKTNVITPLPIIYTIASDGSISASANPFNSDSNGEYVFAVEPGSYSIEATGSSAVLNISKTITQFTPSDPASSASTSNPYPFNRLSNSFFYGGLTPWIASGTNAPTWIGSKTYVTGSGSCEQVTTTPASTTTTQTGSVSQSVSLPSGSTSVLVQFATSIRTSLSNNNYSGYVKLYLMSGATGVETLIDTFTYSILAGQQGTIAWTPRVSTITGYVSGGGDYLIRLEISATAQELSGISPVFCAIGVDDVYVVA